MGFYTGLGIVTVFAILGSILYLSLYYLVECIDAGDESFRAAIAFLIIATSIGIIFAIFVTTPERFGYTKIEEEAYSEVTER